MNHCSPDLDHSSQVTTVAEAGTYITRVCFKHGPPRRIGMELEWLLVDPREPTRRPTGPELIRLLGRHTPRTLDPASPAEPLPDGGSVTVEPGGQIEISSAPAESVGALVAALSRDIDALAALLAPAGLELASTAADPHRPPLRLLHTPRYNAMAEAFDQVSPAGRVMMCSTAAVQVCLDLGTAADAADRWRAAHQLGPVLLAAFANSPRSAAGAASVPSTRMAAWWQLDPVRTRPPSTLDPADYVDRVLDTQVLAICRPDAPWRVTEPLTLRQWADSDRPLTTADIDLHLSMLFPPVRPQGYLELRYLDAQPGGEWIAPLGLVAALFADPATVAEVLAVTEPVATAWERATELGLADPALALAARRLLAVAQPRLAGLDLPPDSAEALDRLLQRRLGDAISPATDQLTREG